MKPTLLVLAAGMGSRYGGLKQLDGLGPHGETIMDYSIYDALRAGFGKVVFVIRKDIEKEFREKILSKYEGHIAVETVFQAIDNLPAGFICPADRTKPWGTNHAVMMAADVIKEPFAVINADDFYGADAFKLLGDFLKEPSCTGCSVDFMLANTLSDIGSVNRGICRTDASHFLTLVEETKEIRRGEDGVIRGKFRGEERILNDNDTTSMSMWGFKAEFPGVLEKQLGRFLNALPADDLTSELTIADCVGREITENGFRCLDIPTDSRWFGITYESETAQARKTLKSYVESGVYGTPLFGN